MAGVNLTIEQLTWADWLSQCWVDKDYQMTMMNFFTLWEPDFLYYSVWNSEGAFNYRAVKDPIIDELTAKARVTVEDAARADIYKQVQKQIFDEAHDVLLWFRNGTIGAQTKVMGGAGYRRASERVEPELPQGLAGSLTQYPAGRQMARRSPLGATP